MSSDEIAVRVEAVSKRYEIYAAPPDRLRQMVAGPANAAANALRSLAGRPAKPVARHFREFWALRDVSLEVRRGESLAIIGRNGSGKSTLLQVIAGTLSPTSGTVAASGRIAALLELGSGFNLDFSGRDNIYLNCAILGIPRAEVDRRLDAILAFADIGDFIDEPVKTYSSGMMVRLAFAVQANVDAEVVIIDEALAVGDVFFAQKCFARLRSLVDSGAAVIFVTHDMSTVTQFCQRALVLHHGREVFQGDSVRAIRRYLAADRAGAAEAPPAEPVEFAPAGSLAEANSAASDPRWPAPALLERRADADVVGAGEAEFLGVAIRDSRGEPSGIFEIGERAEIYYDFRLDADIGIPVGGLSIVNEKNIIVHGRNSLQTGVDDARPARAGSRLRFRQRITLDLTPGEYTLVIGLACVDEDTLRHYEHMSHDELTSRTRRVASVGRAASFRVVFRRSGLALTHHGLCNLPGDITLLAERADAPQEPARD